MTRHLLSLFLIGILTISTCGRDVLKEAQGILDVGFRRSNAPSSVRYNQTISFSLYTDQASFLQNLSTYKLEPGGSETLIHSLNNPPAEVSYPFSYTPTLEDAGKRLMFVVRATTNSNNRVASHTYTVRILPLPNFISGQATLSNVVSVNNENVFLSLDHDRLTSYRLSDGELFRADIGLIINNSSQIKLISPHWFTSFSPLTIPGLSNPRNTYFGTGFPVDQNAFNNLNTTLELIRNINRQSGRFSGLSQQTINAQVNDVIGFRAQSGRRGYILINAIDSASNTATISIKEEPAL
ncbi:MAG: hypothetical protein MI784_05925 [Cytophagales bacterium]|nr:hypothetical protein [Cytophagales bacterium]